MWTNRFWGAHFFCIRYWTKFGATLTFNAAWAQSANRTVGVDIEPD